MPYSNKVKKLLLVTGAFALVAFGLWVGLFAWARNLANKYEQGELALASEGQKEIYYTSVTKVLRDTAEEQSVLATAFIEAGEESIFLENIENLATRSNVDFKIFGFEKRDTTLRTSLQFRGSFENTYYFIKLVESMPVKLGINKASLEEIPSDEEGKTLWEGRFDLDVLSYLPSEVNVTPELE